MNSSAGSKQNGRTILYYPTIALPSGPWLRQALLFWDEISSIVPMTYDDDVEKEVPAIPYSSDVKYLAEQNVFRPIQPSQFFHLGDYLEKRDELFEELKRIVMSKPFRRRLSPRGKRAFTAKIHRHKVSAHVYNWLHERQLAEQFGNDRTWFRFEHDTGLLYMGLLAKYLADVDAKHTMPGTDRAEYESLLYGTGQTESGVTCLDVRYKAALPIPRSDASLSDILRFKEDYRKELYRFRRQLDDLHRDLSNVESRNEVSQMLAAFREDMETGLSELSETLHNFSIETVSGCMKTIVNLKSPTLWSTAAVAATEAAKLAEVPLEWTIPGIAVAGGIEVACYLVHRTNQKRATLRGSNFAYLYHAEQSGLISLS